MNRPIHFEIHAPDPQAAMAYYEATLGWKFTKWAGGPVEYWIADTGEGAGINGGLMRSRDGQGRTINTVEVPDVDAAVAKALATGGKLARPKMAVPGVGWLAYCTDPGGNIYGMMHADKNAR